MELAKGNVMTASRLRGSSCPDTVAKHPKHLLRGAVISFLHPPMDSHRRKSARLSLHPSSAPAESASAAAAAAPLPLYHSPIDKDGVVHLLIVGEKDHLPKTMLQRYHARDLAPSPPFTPSSSSPAALCPSIHH